MNGTSSAHTLATVVCTSTRSGSVATVTSRRTVSGSRVPAVMKTRCASRPVTVTRVRDHSPWNGSGTPATSHAAPAFGTSSCQPPRYSESQSNFGSPYVTVREAPTGAAQS